MKLNKIDTALFYSLFFLGGVAICYGCTQYKYFRMDYDLNAWETLLSIMSIAVGLFIAISLQRKYNKNQNLYDYLVNRLDTMWSEFNAFAETIDASDKIEFTRITKVIRDLQRKNEQFTKLLVELDTIENSFETDSENLLGKFEKCIKKDGITYYDTHKTEIIILNNKIINNYISIYKAINEKA